MFYFFICANIITRIFIGGRNMAKNSLIAWVDELPWIVKIVFCIPLLDIIWAIYRIIKGATENNLLLLIVGILWIVPGSVVCWIIDLVSTILFSKPILS